MFLTGVPEDSDESQELFQKIVFGFGWWYTRVKLKREEMIKMRTNNVKQTRLECPQCGSIMPIMRKRGKQKEAGHIKHMYCFKCNEVVGFVEIKDKDDNISYWENMWKEREEKEIENREKREALAKKKKKAKAKCRKEKEA